MSQDQIVPITILKELKNLIRSDFLKFKQIVSLNQVNHIRVPSSNFGQSMNQQKITVLNVFLYFIISVKSRVKFFPDDLNEEKYRVLCVNQISHYYIRNKMNIELRQFAFIAGAVLDINFHECAHIVFFLIYGKFASHPYIKSLFEHVPSNRLNFNKSKTGFQTQLASKRKFVNHSTQFQLNQFQQELRRTLKPEEKKLKFNRRLINKPFLKQQKKQDHFNNTYLELCKDEKYGKEDSKNNMQFAQRFNETSTSFVIQSLPCQKTQQTFRISSKMGLTRRQKFNDCENRVNQQQKSFNLLSSTRKQQNNQSLNSLGLAVLEIGKIKINNLKKISSKLRAQNLELDQVRLYCRLKQNQHHVQQADQRIQVQKQEKYQQRFIQSNVQSIRQDFQHNKLQQNHKLNLSKKRSKQKFPLHQQLKQNDQAIFIHAEETKRQNKKKDKNTKQFCPKEYQGWKNVKCKERVQQFKKQYRKFLSMQLFQKVMKANQSENL